MNAIRTPTDGNPAEMVLLVVTEQTTGERYAKWLAPRYPAKLATDERTALDVIGDDTAVIVLSSNLQNVAPPEFLEQARTAGYDGKVALITDPRSEIDRVEADFDSVLSKRVSKSALIETVDKLTRRVRYENHLERHLSLAKKRAQWEVQMQDEELETHKGYANLVAELNGLETEFDGIFSSFEADDFSALFRGVLS